MDELDQAIDILLGHRPADGNRGHVIFAGQNHVLEIFQLAGHALGLHMGPIEFAVDR